MGLRADVQDSVADAFDGDLNDAVKEFVLEQSVRTDGTYDTATGLFTAGAVTNYSSRGVFSNYDLEERFNTAIEVTDLKLIILANEITADPNLKDVIIEGTDRYRIINKSFDPAIATITLQIRKAST